MLGWFYMLGKFKIDSARCESQRFLPTAPESPEFVYVGKEMSVVAIEPVRPYPP